AAAGAPAAAPGRAGWPGLRTRVLDRAMALAPSSRILLTMGRSHLAEAGRALGANKVRSSLSTLGILIGVAAVIAMVALGTGAKRSMTDTISKMGSSVISVMPNWWRAHGHGGGGREFAITRLTTEDAAALKRAHPAIRRTAPVYWCSVALTANGKNWNCSCIGSSPEYAEVRAQHPSVGRFYTAAEAQDRARVILLGRTPYRELYGEGVNPIGQVIRVNKIPFTIIGILPEKGSMGRWDPDDNVLVPLGTGMYRLGGDRYISSVDIQVDPEADVDEIVDRVKRFLIDRYRLKGDREESFDVRNEIAMRQAWVQVSQTMAVLLGVIAGISLLVGGIGIMNIMLVSVTERTREIGLRKAVGARQRDILFQFLLEAVTISLLGGTLGILLGTGISWLLAYFLEWTIVVTAWSVILAFGFSAAVGIGFGFWPARRAARLHPAEALRYE
ncbi:MAG: ABC transporter permease, partial [Candidatus Coatesbacteria bacterium]